MGLTSIWRGLSRDLSESRRSAGVPQRRFSTDRRGARSGQVLLVGSFCWVGLTPIWRGPSRDLSESRRSGPPPIGGVGDRGRTCLSRVSARWDWSLTPGFRSRSRSEVGLVMSQFSPSCDPGGARWGQDLLVASLRQVGLVSDALFQVRGASALHHLIIFTLAPLHSARPLSFQDFQISESDSCFCVRADTRTLSV